MTRLKKSYLFILVSLLLLSVAGFLVYSRNFTIKEYIYHIFPNLSPKVVVINENSNFQLIIHEKEFEKALFHLKNKYPEYVPDFFSERINIISTETEQHTKFSWIDGKETLVYASRSSEENSSNLTIWVQLNYPQLQRYKWTDDQISQLAEFLVFASIFDNQGSLSEDKIQSLYKDFHNENLDIHLFTIKKV